MGEEGGVTRRWVVPEDPDPAAVGAVEPQQAADRRRLAGTVGTEEAEDLASVDRQAHVADAPSLAEGLGQVLDKDGRGRHESPSLATIAKARTNSRYTGDG